MGIFLSSKGRAQIISQVQREEHSNLGELQNVRVLIEHEGMMHAQVGAAGPGVDTEHVGT